MIGACVALLCGGAVINAAIDRDRELSPVPGVPTPAPNNIADLVPTTQSTPDAVRRSLEAAAEASREAEEKRELAALDKELAELREQQDEEEAAEQEEEEEPASAYYSSCADARAAGAAPMRRGEPGYRSGLDRDNDGIACDT